jgi:hypothetical protein
MVGILRCGAAAEAYRAVQRQNGGWPTGFDCPSEIPSIARPSPLENQEKRKKKKKSTADGIKLVLIRS